MELLKEKIEHYFVTLGDVDPPAFEKANAVIHEDNLVSPFTENNIKLATLLSAGAISLDEYIQLERDYGARNKFLYVFELNGPRTFGEHWAQDYLKQQVDKLQNPSKTLDSNYSGEYDFWFDGIRIEVKASRAVLDKSGGRLVDKALYSDDKTSRFNMNFQQLKPACCDVFVWMGVWRDTVKYWVLSSDEVLHNAYFSSGQHRGNTGEGQLWIKQSNIKEFDVYQVEPSEILNAIIKKAN